jgi:hypothetical protein
LRFWGHIVYFVKQVVHFPAINVGCRFKISNCFHFFPFFCWLLSFRTFVCVPTVKQGMLEVDIIRSLGFTAFFVVLDMFFRYVPLPAAFSNLKIPSHPNPAITPRLVAAGYFVSFTHGLMAFLLGLYVHLGALIDGTHQVYNPQPAMVPMQELVAWQHALLIGYMTASIIFDWHVINLQFVIHHVLAILIYGYCLNNRLDVAGSMGLEYMMAELPNPFLNGRWLTRAFNFQSITPFFEAGFATTWFLMRFPFEMMIVYRFIWHFDAMPMWWRVAAGAGGVLILVWSYEIFAMVSRRIAKSPSRVSKPGIKSIAMPTEGKEM